MNGQPFGGSTTAALAPARRAGAAGSARVTRQSESKQRRGDKREQRGIDEIGAAPSDGLEQQMGGGPAHRRGEAAGKRQRRDRASCRGAEDAAERGEGGIIERRGDGDAEQHPDREIGDGMIGMDEQDADPSARQERADRHDPMSAVAVDQQPDPRRREPGGEQRERKAAHGEGHRPAALGRDQRHGQDRRIEDRAPGKDLRDAEHQDGAPGTGDDFTKRGHDGTRRAKGIRP